MGDCCDNCALHDYLQGIKHPVTCGPDDKGIVVVGSTSKKIKKKDNGVYTIIPK